MAAAERLWRVRGAARAAQPGRYSATSRAACGRPPRRFLHTSPTLILIYSLAPYAPYEPYAPRARQVAALEALVWRTLDQLGDLAQRAGRSRAPLPPPLLALRPPPPSAAAAAATATAAGLAAQSGVGIQQPEPPPAGASSGAAHGERGERAAPEPQLRDGGRGGAEASGGPGAEAHWVGLGVAGGAAGDAYPPLRRAQRLAYQLASLLVDSFDVAEGRQARLGGRRTGQRAARA